MGRGRGRRRSWRRRKVGGASGTVDVQVAASADDGYCIETFFNGTSVVGAGKFDTRTIEGWARFLNVTIPQGATVDMGYVTIYGHVGANDGAGVKTNMHMNDIDDAVAPTDCTEFSALAKTTAFTAWDDEDLVDAATNSPSLVTAIQEVVNRGSWASGNAMQLVWVDDASTDSKWYSVYSYDDDTAKAINLHVEWSS